MAWRAAGLSPSIRPAGRGPAQQITLGRGAQVIQGGVHALLPAGALIGQVLLQPDLDPGLQDQLWRDPALRSRPSAADPAGAGHRSGRSWRADAAAQPRHLGRFGEVRHETRGLALLDHEPPPGAVLHPSSSAGRPIPRASRGTTSDPSARSDPAYLVKTVSSTSNGSASGADPTRLRSPSASPRAPSETMVWFRTGPIIRPRGSRHITFRGAGRNCPTEDHGHRGWDRSRVTRRRRW